MGKKDIIKAKNMLFELFHNRNISVDKIVIYGSYARSSARPDSDIDIIVVSKDFRRKDIFSKVALTRGIHGDLVDKINMPVDLLYYSDMEWERGSSIIINTAKREGLIFDSQL